MNTATYVGEREREKERERKREREEESWRLTGTVVSNKAEITFTLSSGHVTDPIITPTTEQLFNDEKAGEKMAGETSRDGWDR